MDFHALLAHTHTFTDLGPFIRALGGELVWTPLPADAWPRRRHPEGETLVVAGRIGMFAWFALQTQKPAATAQRLARQLGGAGHVGGILAFNPHERTLALSVAFGECPVLMLSLDIPHPEAIASLARLASAPSDGRLAYAAQVADALAAQPVGHRFFTAFRATLDAMTNGLPSTIRHDIRRDFVLLQLTRVLFLYFVQAKGWLANHDRFLGNAIDRCRSQRRKIHRDLLRPLFFGTLNRPARERTTKAAAFGTIPFLNGGLFEPHPLERQCRTDIPNDLWYDAFHLLFERFHFTVTERQHGHAVAPDMLGRVFEGVMAADVRRATGTFYTPAALVDRMVEGALVAFLTERLSCSTAEAERHLQDSTPAAQTALSTVTLLDPAVGSGAFLLGALERLASLGGSPSAARKRYILQQNLFGVDRNPMAVRLTELRLWLAVIADDSAEQPEAVTPLPNLDCLIRQGDSLLEPVSLTPGSGPLVAAATTELATLRRDVITATGTAKRTLIRKLRSTELSLLTASLTETEFRLRTSIASLLRDARDPDLFGGKRGLDRLHSRELARLRTALREARRAQRLANTGEVPWFHYGSQFADVVVQRAGFDIVIGNPPWQRAEQIPAGFRQRLTERYRWWRCRRGGYSNPPDLAVAFLERAFELAAPQGVVAMLVPAKILSAGYGTIARHALAADTKLHTVADLRHDTDATFDATVYPLALIATKTPAPRGHRIRTTLASGAGTVKQAHLSGGAPWLLLGDPAHRALAALRADHPRLDERFTCQLGVKTGANRIFLQPPEDLEPDVLRWAIRGRDIRAFTTSTKIRLLWTHDRHGQPRQHLPVKAGAYLKQHQATLRQRTDFIGGAPWMLFRTAAATAPYRVVWADLARHLTAAALTDRTAHDRIPLNTCYVIAANSAPESERLAAWLNSTWLRAAAQVTAVPAASGFFRFNAAVVGALPFPKTALHDPALPSVARAGRRGTDVQASLDTIVADHLHLSARVQDALRGLLHARPSHRR